MKSWTQYYKRLRISFLWAIIAVGTLAAFALPGRIKFESVGENRFTVSLYGTTVGVIGCGQNAEEMLMEARKELALQCDGLLMVEEPELCIVGEEVLFGKIDSESEVIENMKSVLASHVKQTLNRAYTVKVNGQTINLSTKEEVNALLAETIARYDTENEYDLKMGLDPSRELNVFTAQVTKKSDLMTQWEDAGGVQSIFDSARRNYEETQTKEFEEYDLGLVDIGFSEDVEVVEAYLPETEISTLENALQILTEEQEVQQIYEIQTGDTLSEISINVGIPMDTIVEMNADKLDDVNSMIHVGDKLIITVPKPELSVIWTSREHYEESYEAEIIYVPNDEWYTTQQVTLQEPSAGYREVIADVTHQNDDEIERNIVKQEVVMEAVPKIVERGTKIPPTYVKPISGGRFTSGFGRRTAPTAGASSYHKGVDWATAVGTPVCASSGGVVAKAGWGSGYGYVVYINHPDGRQTRYGHLSKIYVSAGQSVSQGDKIALSGNSGVSTGPHIHFEILINGTQVNPLNYLN